MRGSATSAGILAGAREQYALGNNVSGWLQAEVGPGRGEEIVEIAYDLQAGSYTEYRRDHALAFELLAAESAALLDAVLRPGDQLLDAGCGEVLAHPLLDPDDREGSIARAFAATALAARG